MAFSGSATVKQVSDRVFRITGLSLAIYSLETEVGYGTIGLDGDTGDVDLPTGGMWGAYAANGAVSLADAVECRVVLAGDAVVAPAVQVTKSGTTVADFLLELRNRGAAATTALEIYVTFH